MCGHMFAAQVSTLPQRMEICSEGFCPLRGSYRKENRHEYFQQREHSGLAEVFF